MTPFVIQCIAAGFNGGGILLGIWAAVLLQRSGITLPAGQQSWGGGSVKEAAFAIERQQDAKRGWFIAGAAALAQIVGTLLPLWA